MHASRLPTALCWTLLCAVLAAGLQAADGLSLAVVDGGRQLMLGSRRVLELNQPWLATSDWKNVRVFPTDAAAVEEPIADGTRSVRSDDGAHGGWRETITSRSDRLTLRYDFDFQPVASAAHLQWYWRLDPQAYAAACLTGETGRKLPLTPLAHTTLAGLRRLTIMLADLDLDLELSSSDGDWSFRDVRDQAWAKAFRLAYDRPFDLAGTRAGWFEVTIRAKPAVHDWQPVVGERSVDLDGTWQVQAEGGPQQEVAVPGFLDRVSALKGGHRFTYRRQFDVPESMLGARLAVRFDAVGDAAEVYVNRQHVGGHVGPALPFDVDISGVVAPGSQGNTLEVVVSDDSFFGVPRDGTDWRNRRHWIPRGMGMGNRKGLYQDVSLRARPAVNLGQPFVRTAVRSGRLGVTCDVVNGEPQTRAARIEAEVLPLAGGKPLVVIPPVAVELPGLVPTRVELGAALDGLERWQPDHPTLYLLRCRLVDATGAVIDRIDTRFGVREAWFAGRDFVLNGIRCNLRGESPSYAEKADLFATREAAAEMIRRYQAMNCNVLRFHSMPAPPHVLDLCDEMGMLVIDESAIYCSWGMLMPEHPQWLDNCREHLTRLVRRDRNHPSVVLWSAENEALNVNLLTPAMLAAFKAAIDAADGTRAVIFDGDGTAFGLSPENNKHYPSKVEDLIDQGGRHSGYGCDLRSDIYWPAAYHQEIPLGCGEFLFPYEPGQREHEHEAITMMGLQSRGYRYANWCDIRPYLASYCGFLRPEGVRDGYQDAYDTIRLSFAPIAVFDKDYDALGPAPQPPRLKLGEPVRRTLIVYNDAFSDEQVEVAWRLLAGDRELAGAVVGLRIGLGDHAELPIAFTPSVAGELRLELASRKAGAECFRDVRRFVAE